MVNSKHASILQTIDNTGQSKQQNGGNKRILWQRYQHECLLHELAEFSALSCDDFMVAERERTTVRSSWPLPKRTTLISDDICRKRHMVHFYSSCGPNFMWTIPKFVVYEMGYEKLEMGCLLWPPMVGWWWLWWLWQPGLTKMGIDKPFTRRSAFTKVELT